MFREDIVLFPISFSIPKDRIVARVPEKTAFVVNDSSRSWQVKNYRFGPSQEEDYFRYLQRHRFGDTRRKGGFDCLRHYELLASGCVPILDGLEHLPPSLMTTLPRPLLARAHELYRLPWEGTEGGPGHLPGAGQGAFEDLASELLQYTAEHLTTEATAAYLLRTLGLSTSDTKVLFLDCVAIDNFPSYLTASVFHGLVSLLGDNVIDVPEYEYAYQYGAGTDPAQVERVLGSMWGQGFTLGFKLPRRQHLNRQNISQRIRAREFDLVVFGRMSPYEPCNFWGDFGSRLSTVPQHFEDVFGVYPRERVALFYGDDSGLDDAVVRTHLSRMAASHRGIGYVFMRELLPFVSEGPEGDSLRPVNGDLLQPGCFYEEWLEFFRRWRPPGQSSGGGLRDCAAWGLCNSPEVEEYLARGPHVAHSPPRDPAISQQFCRTGLMLMSAALVQWLGPAACADDFTCANFCIYCTGMYSRHLLNIPAEQVHEEFGVTGASVVYVLSQGCNAGALALQPARLLQRQGVAIVTEAAANAGANGPLAGEFQLRYLLRQGFRVVVAGNVTHEAQAPGPLRAFAERGQLRALPLAATEAGGLCSWLRSPAHTQLHYAHVELEGSRTLAALGCLEEDPQLEWQPSFVSVQLPPAPEGYRIVAQLLAAGYQRFKVSRLGGWGLGGPIGDLASDSLTGPRWRTAEDVTMEGGGLLPGRQLHAAF